MDRRILAVAAVPLLLWPAEAAAQGRVPNRRAPSRPVPVIRTFPIPVQMTPDAWAGGPLRPGPLPFPSPRRQWVRVETEHFTILSSAGVRTTRAIANDLEQLASQLLATGRLFAMPRGRTRFFVFASRSEAQPYFDILRGARVNAAGMTLRHPLGSTTLVDASARGGVTLTPRHELIHDLIHRESHPVPLWIEEGLAEYHSNRGLPIREHVMRLRGRLALPVDAMLTMTPFAPRAGSLDFYAQSWAATAALLSRDPSAFLQLAEDLAAGAEPRAALEERFGMTVDDLSAAMRKSWSPSVSPRSSAAGIDPPTVSLSHAELLFELGELMARFDGGQTEAERHFRSAIASEPENHDLLLRFAERISHDPARSAEARDCALLAASLGAPEARFHAVVGAARAQLREHEAARPHLETALDHRPGDTESAWHLYATYMSLGHRELADALLPGLLETERAHDARKVLLAADLDRADALARSGQYGEAARVLRELAPKMPPKTRASIEVEVAKLEGAERVP